VDHPVSPFGKLWNSQGSWDLPEFSSDALAGLEGWFPWVLGSWWIILFCRNIFSILEGEGGGISRWRIIILRIITIIIEIGN
jgi:hypothetical protein